MPRRAACLRQSTLREALLTAALLALALPGWPATTVRIKDLAAIHGLAGPQLIGYGLVVGLEGTGDSTSTIFTARALANMLEQFGITVPADQIRADNVAAVMVTAEVPAQLPAGARVDCTVSSIGDADSLQGGVLLATPLLGPDGELYAIAQGPVSIGGFNAQRGGSKVQKNHPLVGRIPNGARILRDLSAPLAHSGRLCIILHNPDFTTAQRIADAINTSLNQPLARAVSSALVEVTVPERYAAALVPFITRIEDIPVAADAPARVVINERTGTVIISGRVRILPVAIAHGGLTIEITTRWQVSQPPPLVGVVDQSSTVAIAGQSAQSSAQSQSAPNAQQSQPQSQKPAANQQPPSQQPQQPSAPSGQPQNENQQRPQSKGQQGADSQQAAKPAAQPAAQAAAATAQQIAPPQPTGSLTGGTTVVVPQTRIRAREKKAHLQVIPEQASLEDLVAALNALGVTPRDLIAIIQALKQAGALQAELIVQ